MWNGMQKRKDEGNLDCLQDNTLNPETASIIIIKYGILPKVFSDSEEHTIYHPYHYW